MSEVQAVAVADPPVPVWQPGRFDRWLQCPGALAMENAISAVSVDDGKAFRALAKERALLPLQILADGATAALMHLAPGSVCSGCLAADTCPQIVLGASDLV